MAEANDALRRAAFELRQKDQRQALLVAELNHRVKNTLMTVQAMAALTARSAANPDEYKRSLEARIIALSKTHNLLTEASWEAVSLRDLLQSEAIHFTYRLRHRDGTYRWMLSRGAPLEVGGVVREWIGILLDIHEQVLLKEAQRAGEERMRLAMEAAALIVWEVDLATRQITHSDNARAVFGFDPPAGVAMLDLIHPDDASRVRGSLEAAMASDVPFNERLRLVSPDGRVLTLVGRGQRRRDHEGRWRFVGITSVVATA